MQVASRLFLSLRHVRAKGVQERARVLILESMSRVGDIRRRAAVEHLGELMTSLVLADSDGMAYSTLKVRVSSIYPLPQGGG